MNLRKYLLAFLLSLGIFAGTQAPALAGPMMVAPQAIVATSTSPIQEARWFCHRGPVFLHWGRCGYRRYYWHPHYYHRYYWHPHYYHRYYWHPHYYRRFYWRRRFFF